MEWLVGIVSGLISAALWSVVAWVFVRSQRDARRDIQLAVARTRSWQVQVSSDRTLARLTYVGRGSAKSVRIGLDSTNPPTEIVAPSLKRSRTITHNLGVGTSYMRVDHQARPPATGAHRIMKLLWLDRLDYRQDVSL